MKISLVQIALVLGFVGMSVAKEAEAQEVLNRKISVQMSGEKLKDVLSQIEKSANVKFFLQPTSHQVKPTSILQHLQRNGFKRARKATDSA